MAYIYQYWLLADFPLEPPLPFQPQPPTPPTHTHTHTCLQWTNWQRNGAETLWTALSAGLPPSTDSEHTLLRICMYVCAFVCLHEFEWWRNRPIITTEICVGFFLVVGGTWLLAHLSASSAPLGCSHQSGYCKTGQFNSTVTLLYSRRVYTCSLSGITFKSYPHHISLIPYHCILVHRLTVTHKEIKMCFRLLLFRWI